MYGKMLYTPHSLYGIREKFQMINSEYRFIDFVKFDIRNDMAGAEYQYFPHNPQDQPMSQKRLTKSYDKLQKIKKSYVSYLQNKSKSKVFDETDKIELRKKIR